ncbi:DUF4290 domain-containing protein [Porphyromonas circumdentaria]|uniref:DUF4290 domain-containing protein n=1 Tax=Porphyromonas circumdentaria TaxID=29524 RepID=A0A1T4PGU4_9PORP|nr:DUF4290 domain-containing protein [Porphyromonas circumdentaria]MBB6275722.1 hypothetical protein [Porphyromonas circumdentaria]MDO4722715.1 DUF4290 domain-containing protein [Porphyromonas circumdentaria]SJZ90456.1 protein of unknown function [Porphyromonas circumdentaria]
MEDNNNLIYQKRSDIIMREYGRNVQSMVNHCLSIQDREKRQACAETIISIMRNLFPERSNTPDGEHILWDHLAIMADFQLDIDYPIEVIKKEHLTTPPDHIPYAEKEVIYKHYGHNIQSSIDLACKMPESPEREAVALQIANHMKTLYLTWNKDFVDDYQIFKDLFYLSGGVLILNERDHKLHTTEETHSKVPRSKNRKHK